MNKRIFSIEPIATNLYVPPIKWKGDPKGHIGYSDAFIFVLEGECYLSIENQCCVLKNGDLAFLPKSLNRVYTPISPDFRIYTITFDITLNGRNIFDLLSLRDSNYQVNVQNKEYIAQCFENSIEYKFPIDERLYVCKAQNIMCILNEYIKLRRESSFAEKPFENVIDYLKANIDKKISINELANIAFMQPNYFVRKFTKTIGLSPIQYHAKLKCYRAMSLLANSNITLDEAARMIGIYDYTYFTRFFKKHCGISPTEYKKLLKT